MDEIDVTREKKLYYVKFYGKASWDEIISQKCTEDNIKMYKVRQ
jgi:hypothetical protein